MRKLFISLKINERSERNLKEDFILILRNYQHFFSNVYNATNTSLNERFIFMINGNNISLLDFRRFEVLSSYEYSNIIYTTFVNNDFCIVFFQINEEYNTKSEIRLNFYSTDARLICEDIISYCQFQLINCTTSKYIIKENPENKFNDELELKDFLMIYQRYLPCTKEITLDDSSSVEVKTFRNTKKRASKLTTHGKN